MSMTVDIALLDTTVSQMVRMDKQYDIPSQWYLVEKVELMINQCISCDVFDVGLTWQLFCRVMLGNMHEIKMF